MSRTINVKPVETIELKFNDGKTLKMRFDTQALMHMEDECVGGLSNFAKVKNQAEMCAIILYIGTVSNCKYMTLERARTYVSKMQIGTISEIINAFMEETSTMSNEEMKALQKKTMLEFLTKMANKK